MRIAACNLAACGFGAGMDTRALHMTLHIRTIADLHRAEQLVSWLHRPHVHRVQVELPRMAADERRRVSETAGRDFNDGGCFWGVPAFLAVLLAS
jgi:hypothetical protein